MAGTKDRLTPSSRRSPSRYAGVENRVQLVAVLITLAFTVLCIQFWSLQVANRYQFKKMAKQNTVRTQRLQSERGVVYGRNGDILANNRASSDIVFVPGPGPSSKEYPSARHQDVCKLLERLIGVSSSALLEEVRAHRREPFTQILVKRDVTQSDRTRVEEHSYALPGVFTVVRPRRRYMHGTTAGQILGYLGEIGPAELAASNGYTAGDLIGRGGLERTYEQLLHGRDGYMLVTKYASGRPQLLTDKYGVLGVAPLDSEGHSLLLKERRRRDPVPGQSLHTTLDIGLQAKCEALLGGKAGAIVVLNADTGETLALASNPSYDPGAFVSPSRTDERLALLSAASPNPMLARAYRENYPPGSLFKVMLAAAALDERVITSDTAFFCGGGYKLPYFSHTWHCWRRSGHGRIRVVQALAFSCDVFFYNVGKLLAEKDKELGVDLIAQWGNSMGLGRKTGIDLPNEAAGNIPTRAWKREHNRDKERSEQAWYVGDTINLSIGQGATITTPLQNAVMIAAIVNGGYRIRPHLNRSLGHDRSERLFSEKTWNIVLEGLRLCVEKGPPAPTGTGYSAHVQGMDIIGKTGTAQVATLSLRDKYQTTEDIPFSLRHHAWFIAGVLDQPIRIALCVLVEHGDSASEAAAPLAREIITYFYGRNSASEITLAQRGTTQTGQKTKGLQ